jgi:hypothetical protein
MEERNHRRLQKMESSPMLMDWQTQYCENGYFDPSNLHVQCNPHENSNSIHDRDLKFNPRFYLEAQKTANSQGNIEQKQQH